MADQLGGSHVFVSYVREDADPVDGLCAVLEASRIPYWRDRKSLGPGDAWKAEIRKAIQSGSLVFLACFSENYRNKPKSHMNEELTLAIEEFRKMPPGRTWLIPVRFDQGDIPEWDLGAGRVLSDLNYVDLFGSAHAAGAASLVTTIHALIGDKRMGPAAALEAVERATSTDRAELLKRLTKEMLVDPTRRIEMDDLVSQEVRRVLDALRDADRVSSTGGSNDEQVLSAVDEARALWELSKPFCASLQVALRWGNPDSLAPWVTGIRSFAQAATKMQGGATLMLRMRHLPVVLALMTAGISAASGLRWDNTKAVLADISIRDRQNKTISILEAVDPYSPFDDQAWTANILARTFLDERTPIEALADFRENRKGRYHTPVAEWLHHILRPLFADQYPDDDEYSSVFDKAEVTLGILAQDAVNVRAQTEGTGPWARSHWFGRLTYRIHHSHGDPVAEMRQELAIQGAKWGPLRADLFGGDVTRASKAIEAYADEFARVARGRW